MLYTKLLVLVDMLAENNKEQTQVLLELKNPNTSTQRIEMLGARFGELAARNAILIIDAKATADEIREKANKEIYK